MFYRRTGDYRHLVPTALQAERIARQIGDTAGIAGSKALLGVSYHLAGNQAEAQAHLDEGVRDDAALRGPARAFRLFAHAADSARAGAVAARLSRPRTRLRPPARRRRRAARRGDALHRAVLVILGVRLGR